MLAISSIRGDKPDHVRDQYGFAVGGPIIKNKTFFFVDFEKIRQQDPTNLEGIVPTALERTGDFSQSPANSQRNLQSVPMHSIFSSRRELHPQSVSRGTRFLPETSTRSGRRF